MNKKTLVEKLNEFPDDVVVRVELEGISTTQIVNKVQIATPCGTENKRFIFISGSKNRPKGTK